MDIPAVDRPVLLFDGYCNLCNRWVNFVIDRDPEARILLAPLQSAQAGKLLESAGGDPETADTVVFIDDGRIYMRSDAILRLSGYLSGPVSLLRFFRPVPRIMRDALYRLIARNRYAWFGRRNECRMPGPGDKQRFLAMSDEDT
ncbi:thiol-disulfide oxidoreductase DCC family protein [Balneolales bacterium ANBcel1]|nr:thiol-disulfide oxidoreductase DCC family protein [Balneolales bacterium ANBcel1]